MFLIAGAILGIALLFLLARRRGRAGGGAGRRPPGLAARHPRLGNLPDLAAAGSLPAFLASLHAAHGPVASFWHGEVFTVSLASPDHFRCTQRMFGIAQHQTFPSIANDTFYINY